MENPLLLLNLICPGHRLRNFWQELENECYAEEYEMKGQQMPNVSFSRYILFGLLPNGGIGLSVSICMKCIKILQVWQMSRKNDCHDS